MVTIDSTPCYKKKEKLFKVTGGSYQRSAGPVSYFGFLDKCVDDFVLCQPVPHGLVLRVGAVLAVSWLFVDLGLDLKGVGHAEIGHWLTERSERQSCCWSKKSFHWTARA